MTLVFLLAAAFVIYVLAGYPLLLGLWARCVSRSRPIRKKWEPKSVSILLAVHNGEQWIRNKLESILELDYPPELLQILVISNGSTDSTDAIVEEFASRGVQLVHSGKRGKPAALNAGMQRATGEVLFFTDVRQELDPASLRHLVACLADDSVGVVSGELVIRRGDRREEADTGLYWRYEKWIRSRLSRIDSTLGATGCIYAMRRELAVRLPEETLLDDVHLPLAAYFRGYRVILEENAKAFDFPTSRRSEFQRKVRTLAGVYQIVRTFPALLGPGNRMWLHFVSHKLGRLALPFALLLLAVSSVGLPMPWAVCAVAAEAGFLTLALLNDWVPETWRIKKLCSPIHTFVVLMAAAFMAPWALLGSRAAVWKETQVSSVRPYGERAKQARGSRRELIAPRSRGLARRAG